MIKKLCRCRAVSSRLQGSYGTASIVDILQVRATRLEVIEFGGDVELRDVCDIAVKVYSGEYSGSFCCRYKKRKTIDFLENYQRHSQHIKYSLIFFAFVNLL